MFKKQNLYVFTCDMVNCDEEAMSFRIDRDSLVIIHQFGKSTYYEVFKKFEDEIIKALERGDLSSVIRFIREPKNWCRKCDKVYCKDHWETWPIFEEDGWYDYSKGICPEGHEVLLAD